MTGRNRIKTSCVPLVRVPASPADRTACSYAAVEYSLFFMLLAHFSTLVLMGVMVWRTSAERLRVPSATSKVNSNRCGVLSAQKDLVTIEFYFPPCLKHTHTHRFNTRVGFARLSHQCEFRRWSRLIRQVSPSSYPSSLWSPQCISSCRPPRIPPLSEGDTAPVTHPTTLHCPPSRSVCRLYLSAPSAARQTP